ncbi:MAG TPA: hypothetical protein VF290_21615 [Pyrinomonadaceae bacterium]
MSATFNNLFPFIVFGILLLIAIVFLVRRYLGPITLGTDSRATNPGSVRLSDDKLKLFHPELYSLTKWIPWVLANGWKYRDCPAFLRRSVWRSYFSQHLQLGDSQPAVCLTTTPQVVVAAYSIDIDCVAVLVFPDEFAQRYSLHSGKRLISVNTYQSVDYGYGKDLSPGPECSGLWGNFSPLIADFLTDDLEKLERRKREIPENRWTYLESLGYSYLTNRSQARSGAPMRAAEADVEWLLEHA